RGSRGEDRGRGGWRLPDAVLPEGAQEAGAVHGVAGDAAAALRDRLRGIEGDRESVECAGDEERAGARDRLTWPGRRGCAAWPGSSVSGRAWRGRWSWSRAGARGSGWRVRLRRWRRGRGLRSRRGV